MVGVGVRFSVRVRVRVRVSVRPFEGRDLGASIVCHAEVHGSLGKLGHTLPYMTRSGPGVLAEVGARLGRYIRLTSTRLLGHQERGHKKQRERSTQVGPPRRRNSGYWRGCGGGTVGERWGIRRSHCPWCLAYIFLLYLSTALLGVAWLTFSYCPLVLPS